VFRPIKERRRKMVPLPPELAALLRAHRAAQAHERLEAGPLWQDFGLVFAREDGTKIDLRADWEEWRDILKAAGIGGSGVHLMRHSAATLAIEEGVALPVVKELLGHADQRTTDGYVHVSPALVRAG
jgi:integrase